MASLPIWSSERLLLVLPGVLVGSPPSPSTPGHTFRSCIPCRNILETIGVGGVGGKITTRGKMEEVEEKKKEKMMENEQEERIGRKRRR